MAIKSYRIYFARTSVGNNGRRLSPHLAELEHRHGQNLPPVSMSGDAYQIRDLRRIGNVWRATFAKLRDDAPHIVKADNREQEIPLDDGDKILEKSHFLLREQSNVVVWQVNRNAGALSRLERYLSELLNDVVLLPLVMDEDRLEQVMAGQLYQIEFAYDRPRVIDGRAASWNQSTFDMMNRIDAAHAKFVLRAQRNGHLLDTAKAMVRQLVGANETNKIRVRLTEETEPIELFAVPLKDEMRLELIGRYPVPARAFEGLEEAFDRQRGLIRDVG